MYYFRNEPARERIERMLRVVLRLFQVHEHQSEPLAVQAALSRNCGRLDVRLHGLTQLGQVREHVIAVVRPRVTHLGDADGEHGPRDVALHLPLVALRVARY